MKRTLLLLSIIFALALSCAAQTKISALPSGTPVPTDIVPYVSDPAGTAVTKQTSVQNLLGVLTPSYVATANKQGNGPKFQLFGGGSVATNDCAKFDASGNIVSAGAACGTGGGITTLNSQTGATQTLSKTDDTNVTLTITSATNNHAFALGWTGTLAKARQHSATVYNDQANTFGASLQAFQAGGNFELRDPADTTKRLRLDLSGFTTGNTRTLTPPDYDGTIATRAGTETLTNKTIDAEGAGNVITFPVKVFLAAAGCANTTAASFWDLPTSTPAVAACVTGTNVQKGTLDFADTSGGFSAQNTLLLPADFSGAIDARIVWTTSAASGNAKWSLSTVCTDVAAAATDDPSFNTASTVTTAAPGTANRVQTSSITALTITGCGAGNLLHLKLFRDGNDGSDTIAATARLIGVELTIRRAM